MERYDAAVIGAGPAGAVTAIHLAHGGARVLLLDRARFPRDKPCSGGLTLRAVRQLPVDPSPVVEHEVDRIELRLAGRSRFERRARAGPLVLMTQRRRLDHYLVQQAVAAGAEFRDGVRVYRTPGRLRIGGGRCRCLSRGLWSRPRSSSAPTAPTAPPPARLASPARSPTL